MEMANNLNPLVEWLVIASIKSTPIIVVVLFLRKILFTYLSAGARYGLWFSVVISLTIPIGWQFNIPFSALNPLNTETGINNEDPFNDLSETHLSGEEMYAFDSADDLSTTNTTDSKQNTLTLSTFTEKKTDSNVGSPTEKKTDKQALTYAHIFVLLWLAGLLIFGFLIAASFYRHYRITNEAVNCSTSIHRLFDLCAEKISLNRKVTLLQSQDVRSPTVIGWISPRLILPVNLDTTLSEKEISHVLLHELGHIKRNDILFNWMLCIVNLLHWFNSLVWLFVRIMRRDMEGACDAFVLNNLSKDKHRDYGATLIQLSNITQLPKYSAAGIGSATAVGILENHKDLVERINMIKQFKSISAKSRAMFLMIFVGCTLAATAQPLSEKVILTLPELAKVIEENTGKTVDLSNPALQGTFSVKKPTSKVNYSNFLTLLNPQHLTAYQYDDKVIVINKKDIVQHYKYLPEVSENKEYQTDEWVKASVKLKNICATTILPAIRPLIGRFDFFRADLDSGRAINLGINYGNLQRIETIIRQADQLSRREEDCKAKADQAYGPYIGRKKMPSNMPRRVVAEFSTKTSEGKLVGLKTLKGKISIINIWSSNCEVCEKVMPALDRLYKKYQHEGMEIIGVNRDYHEAGRTVLKDYDPDSYSPLQVSDHKKLQAYHDDFLKRVPVSFPSIRIDSAKDKIPGSMKVKAGDSVIIDRTGKIQFSISGFNEDTEALYERTINELLKNNL